VLADETTDIAVIDVDSKYNIKENFLKFIPVNILTGKNLAESILSGN